LEGGPSSVGGDFSCYKNQLTSLEGCPSSVGGGFYCSYNQLTSLEGCPSSVGGGFSCLNNQLISLEGCPSSVGGHFYCNNNPVFLVWILFKDLDKIELFNEYDVIRDDEDPPIIIMDRLNDFLETIGKEPVEKVEGYKCI
jgi:hypothetical protein